MKKLEAEETALKFRQTPSSARYPRRPLPSAGATQRGPREQPLWAGPGSEPRVSAANGPVGSLAGGPRRPSRAMPRAHS